MCCLQFVFACQIDEVINIHHISYLVSRFIGIRSCQGPDLNLNQLDYYYLIRIFVPLMSWYDDPFYRRFFLTTIPTTVI